MAEIITKDCKEYHIWDKVNGVWNRLFFKTNAKSVDADDGKNLETKVGAINGISSSSTATDENIAASIGYVNQELTELNTNLSDIGNFRLLASFNNTTEETITLTDELSNYKYLIYALTSPSFNFMESGIIPVKLFKTFSNRVGVSSQGLSANAYMIYKSDRTIAVKASNSEYTMVIYGVK